MADTTPAAMRLAKIAARRLVSTAVFDPGVIIAVEQAAEDIDDAGVRQLIEAGQEYHYAIMHHQKDPLITVQRRNELFLALAALNGTATEVDNE